MQVFATYGFDLASTPSPAGTGLDQQWDIITGTVPTWANGAGALVAGYPGPIGANPFSSAAVFKWSGTIFASRLIGSQPDVSVGMNFQQSVPGAFGGTNVAQNQFLQISVGLQPIISVEAQLDGSFIVLLAGTGQTGTGTPLGQTAAGISSLDTWLAGMLELSVSNFGSSSTAWALYLNDVRLIFGTVDTSAYSLPDRFTLCNQPVAGSIFNGVIFDNVYAADSRLGPVYISSLLPTGDASGNWITIPGPARYASVDDSAARLSVYPDGNSSTIAPGASTNQLFLFGQSPCYGRNLGVMVNVCYRSGSVDGIVLQQSAIYDLGPLPANGSTFHTYQQFAAVSFVSGTYWTDAEIKGAFWGVGNAAGSVVVTQMFLEKLVSLRNVPFNCGSANYSF